MNIYIKCNNFPGKDAKEDLYLEKESEMVSLCFLKEPSNWFKCDYICERF